MIIFDEREQKKLTDITILLDKDEATQMLGYLGELLSSSADDSHFHLNNSSHSKEITLALYDKHGELKNFACKYRELIATEG